MPDVLLHYPEFGGMYGIKRYAIELAPALRAIGCDAKLHASRAGEIRIAGRGFGGIVTRKIRNHWPVVGGKILHSADYLSNPTFRRADVVTVHDVIPLSHPDLAPLPDAERAMHGRAVRRALQGIVLADTNATREILLAQFDAKEDRVIPIHLGLDHATWRPTTGGPAARFIGKGRLNVAVAMNWEPRKRVDLVLEAAMRLPFVRVLHVGAPNRSPELEGIVGQMKKNAAALEKEGRYVALGRVDDATLASLYAEADVAIHPSLAEGFGYPPLEALACGGRVLASDIPPQREVLGKAARFFKPTAESVTKALEASWTGSAVREATFPAREARLAHARAFTWERCARATMAAYGMRPG